MLPAVSSAFAGWLTAQPPHAIVGTAHDPLGDPLARYCTEIGHHVAAVGYNAVRIGDQIFPLPGWARRFQRLVDTHTANTPILAHDAIALLQRACNATDDEKISLPDGRSVKPL